MCEFLVEDLYTVVARIRDINVPMSINSYISWAIELPSIFAFGPYRVCDCSILREDVYFVLLEVCDQNSVF